MPRKKIIGERLGGEPQDERENFIQCPACGRWLDMRDPGEVGRFWEQKIPCPDLKG